ncbi:N-acetylmuramoyl-L-alanine amidase [Paenibacillus sp. LMG 31456]|uniref:N-acetylmuramoyl-L-alanine amidase n=1 Tax=Paenibacillus foliorum TaxID=2654974 RepID=A0A972GTR2_9BACL|nr:N-acetylmuramoyl-L-alanine amidase [Paenibacillus foliorum]NOU96020.1 N-acetylmuramoyl-L-alanine amidase [Paenibacillus foliorum]
MRRPYAIMMLILTCLLVFPSSSWAMKIVVDAGHGGSDPGAIGVNGLYEKTVNLDISQKLRDILTQKGYEVVMTREDDTFLSLKERVEFTNGQQADLFVSIHANSYTPKSRGAMVLYYDNRYPQESYPASDEMAELTEDSKQFAQQVLDKFVDAVDVENLGLIPSSVYVVRMGTVPSILVETAFLSNKQDAAMLANDTIRTQMAQAIGQGIEAYMPPTAQSIVFPDTRGHWAREAILRMKEQGIVDGVGKQFQPNREMTRAEWVTLLDRVFDLSKVQPTVADAAAAGSGCSAGSGGTVAGTVYDGACAKPAGSFKDATAGHWAAAVLNKAVSAGVLNGYADGTLRPDQPVTRAEVAATFARLALPQAQAAPAAVKQPAFKDVPTSAWSAKAIYSLKQAGWIDGVTADSFAPDRRMTRAEAAVLLDRFVQSTKKTPNRQP